MRLIDADIFASELDFADADVCEEIPDSYCEFGFSREKIRELLRDAPTVDAVPVVYCKDCKYADAERRNATEKRYADSILFCRNPDFCGDEPLAMWPVDFCSYGVAKECADDES